MGTIVHAFELEQAIYAIKPDCGIVSGTVKEIGVELSTVSALPVEKIVYRVNESTQGVTGLTVFNEVDVFIDKAAALTEYGIRLA